MASPALREAYRFIGQVVDHVAARAVAVHDLDGDGRYHAFPVTPSDFPVGSVVECTLWDPEGYIESLNRAPEQIVAEYRRKLVI